MDVDAVQPTRNSPFINYFDVSNNFPWQEPRPEQIRLRRALMHDTLIFDILLIAGGIDQPYAVYPPEDGTGLKKLLDAIEGSNYDILKKDCLVYFLLKWYQDGRERGFQQQRCIPPQFAALADAYWHLDTGINVPRAVAILSDCRLNRDYASKIIVAISISPDWEALLRKYIQTAKPLLIEPLDLERYTIALADSSIVEAWQFTRTFNEKDRMRPRLFKQILEYTVTPHPRPAALKQLLALPLSAFEETVFNDFVQKPPATLEKFSSVAILQDLICVRLLQAGRFADAVKLDRLFTSITPAKNLKYTKDRSKMVHDVYVCLPSVERSLVDLELDPTIPQMSPLVPKPVSPERRRVQEPQNTPLSQSWEDVRMPDALLNKSTSLREVRVPPSAATPLFGGSPFTTSTSSAKAAPILPLNLNGIASGSNSTPRKSFPLSNSILGASKPRSSLSGVGSRMAFGNSPAIASPASGIKLPAPSSRGTTHTFVPADRQQNAFYQPPKKTNGTKRAFEEDHTRSPERPNQNISTQPDDVDMEVDAQKESASLGKEKKRGRKSGSKAVEPEEKEDDSGNVLQYSVFSEEKRKKRPSSRVSSRKSASSTKAPPGTFISDDEQMDQDHEEERDEEEQTRTKRSRTTRTTRGAVKETSNPPAKKLKQARSKDLSLSIPGGRPVRKARSSASVDPMEETEGVQTRRRSSRLTTTGSVNGGSPEPPSKARKTVRAGGAKKKR
ncbi:hypothetical protein M413DRAFT_440532 [Hebeloma cylindrosporum]|uniref:ELYS-like domain-containing protein n=1 Tax=Hebeloma cylindrosporum TaxID=76867 RepID=A0A0C2YAW3_HEBCY|nr:hypothetical protein M413DRAFT_440532 [Hebeloma cylindrosporum h7]